MKLKWKLILLFSCVSLAITVTVGALLYYQLHRDRVLSVQTDTLEQLRHIAFSLNIFIDDMENDVRTLTQIEAVRSKNDGDFTNFTQADEKTFTYHIGMREQQIIDIFQTFRATHPYVSSVYMGRENGSSVRSHKRERPTRYDPRNRSWYVQAIRSPERTVITDPYPSVTTQDINIGIVKALVDETNHAYGVVGIDITLVKLTDYILNFRVKPESKILVVDRRGVVLASQNRDLLFSEIGAYSKNLEKILLNNDQSKNVVTIGKTKNYLFFQESPKIGWKVVVLIPAASIEREIRPPILLTTAGLIFGLLLLSMLTLFGLNVFVIRPLGHLSEETALIAGTSDLDRQVPISSSDEIGILASSFNEMIRALNVTQNTVKKDRTGPSPS